MKITVNLTANLSLDNLELKGLTHHESQKNWDNDVKKNHGRERGNHTSLESIGGSAKADFDMGISIDLQPEEMQSCYSCIEQLVKTVADSYRQTAEAVEKTAEAVKTADLSPIKSEFCFPESPAIEITCREFYQMSDKAHKTKNISDINTALIFGRIAEKSFVEFGYAQTHKARLEDIQGTIRGLKALKEKVELNK